MYNVYLTKLTQLTYAPPSDTILALARFNSALVYVHFQDWNRALESGFDHFMTKPADLDRLHSWLDD